MLNPKVFSLPQEIIKDILVPLGDGSCRCSAASGKGFEGICLCGSSSGSGSMLPEEE